MFSANAIHVLNRRYLADGETPDQMFWRVARAIAAGENQYYSKDASAAEYANNHERWSERFYSELLEPLYFLPNSPCLGNAGRALGQLSACFVLPVPDDMHGIFQSVHDTAMIHQSGGGTGFAFSELRPAGSRVKTTNGVSSGPVSFMEVFDKATEVVKQGGTRRGANMGILHASHPDIEAFIHCKSDMVRFQNFNISVAAPDEFMEAVINNDDWPLVIPNTGEIVKWISAVELFSSIVSEAHRNGDPGLFFIDRANRDNPTPHLGSYIATNPCWAGDTLIATVDGPRPIADLVGTTPLVLSYDPRTRRSVVRRAIRVWQTSTSASTLKVTLDSGTVLRLTPNHNLYVFKGRNGVVKIRADELTPGMSIKAYATSYDPREPGRVRMHNADGNHSWLAREVYEAVYGPIPSGYVVHHADHNRNNNDPSNLVLVSSYDHQSHHYPERLKSGFTTTGRTRKELLAGRYNHKVVSIEQGDNIPVFNMTVEDTHTYVVCDPVAKDNTILSGIVSANCGEEPLIAYESCTLGSIDLSRFVRPYEGIRWADLQSVVRLAVRFLDDVVTVNRFPVRQLAEMNWETRRIGLGVMGWADVLFQLQIPYDSEHAIALAHRVMGFIRQEADAASGNLAISRGDYPANKTGVPMRNSTRTTVAPTGTLSILADCTGGIEPAFALSFKRQHRLDRENPNAVTQMFETNKHFLKVLEEHNLSDERKAEILEAVAHGTPLSEVNNGDLSPWVEQVFQTANELSIEAHVNMQAAFQDHIDAGVSKTVNLPESATEADIAHAYMYAWQSGCKGITTYRDKSREGQVLSYT